MLALRSRLCSLQSRCPSCESPIWLAPILALAMALRLFHIGANSLWFDEAFSWLVARQPAYAILTQRLEPILPPLYHYLLHCWIGLGESEAVLRSFSAICGVITIPVMYLVGREMLTPVTGLAAAALVSVLPFHVYFAQEARLYSLVVFLAALMLWAFVKAWKSSSYAFWVIFGILAGLNFYAHYFVLFTLFVLHLFVVVAHSGAPSRRRGMLIADAVALIMIGPQLLSALAQTRRVASDFWLPIPSPLEPVKTLDYLLFGHTTPVFIVPVALFLTLSILILVTWAACRAGTGHRQWLLLLLALVMIPILLALVLSWLVAPVYLDRSFSLVAPAYVLLLAWGLAHPPRGSPLPWLYGGLMVMTIVSLVNNYSQPDPAKPPFREVGQVLESNWQQADVVLHLHDSSYLPLLYYAPQAGGYLLNNDPDSWLPPFTWEWAGQRVSSLDEFVTGKERLWLVTMPRRTTDRQATLSAQVEQRYLLEGSWMWPHRDSVELRAYDLAATGRLGDEVVK